jgi:hypothetical protein
LSRPPASVRKNSACRKELGPEAFIQYKGKTIIRSRYRALPAKAETISNEMLSILAKLFNPELAYSALGSILFTSGIDFSA